MQVIQAWESLQLSDVVLSIGNFDGVHRGHQTILAAGRRRADEGRTQLVAMTFDPHPLSVLTPDHVPPVLTPLPEKLHWLRHAGVDIAVVVRSRPEFLAMSAEEFITFVIMAKYQPIAVVEGASFGFGHKREGTVQTLVAAGCRNSFDVEIVEPVRVGLGGHPDTVISSSLIRQLLRSGTVDQAALCLGRPYSLLGTVEHGAGRGRELGFPTANIRLGRQLMPAEGVYAGLAESGTHRMRTAVSIGRTPTFEGSNLTIEAHLLDYEGDLYGEPIRLELIEWLRPQEHFRTIDALREQIALDVAQTRELLGSRG
ncbi:MAG: bifunctional riboflavin kinase/FAD synthetase [Phycisphaerae bacterium]|nr:bifunctional riboflavin kinase/FAD synthetase [Phycisphaerae bacterium]